MPPNVEIYELLATGDVVVIIRGRDETVKVIFERDLPWLRDRRELRLVIQMHLKQALQREQKLDAVTAKLMS